MLCPGIFSGDDALPPTILTSLPSGRRFIHDICRLPAPPRLLTRRPAPVPVPVPTVSVSASGLWPKPSQKPKPPEGPEAEPEMETELRPRPTFA